MFCAIAVDVNNAVTVSNYVKIWTVDILVVCVPNCRLEV